jgi:hypothetical protein
MPSRRLPTRFAWFEFAAGYPLDAIEQMIISEPPANTLGGGQSPASMRFGSLMIMVPVMVRPCQLSQRHRNSRPLYYQRTADNARACHRAARCANPVGSNPPCGSTPKGTKRRHFVQFGLSVQLV